MPLSGIFGGRLAIRDYPTNYSIGYSDPFEIAEIPPDHECLSDDVVFRHKAPVAAVAAAVAVVTHREVISGGYLAGKSRCHCSCNFPGMGNGCTPASSMSGTSGLIRISWVVAVQGFVEAPAVNVTQARIPRRCIRHPAPFLPGLIDEQPLVAGN